MTWTPAHIITIVALIVGGVLVGLDSITFGEMLTLLGIVAGVSYGGVGATKIGSKKKGPTA